MAIYILLVTIQYMFFDLRISETQEEVIALPAANQTIDLCL